MLKQVKIIIIDNNKHIFFIKNHHTPQLKEYDDFVKIFVLLTKRYLICLRCGV